jgi:serine/threonine protein phosphatase PrpC
MFIFSWACSDVGRKRRENQDRYLIARDLQLFAVADGMGGYEGGEIAADLAVRTLEEEVRARAEGQARDPTRALVDSIQEANERIRRARAERPELASMGTTTTSVFFCDDKAIIGHVGDSRVYLVRRGRIARLSEDHSLVAMQVKAGTITEEQARTSPFRNIISRALGVDPRVEVDTTSVEVEDGDTFLLCSDGLSSLVSDDEILHAVNENFMHRVPEVLVDLANERGGGDNITVVVAHVVLEPQNERWMCVRS